MSFYIRREWRALRARSKLSRSGKITLLMRLNKGITGKLEAAGYITKERRGRENLYHITDSGKYVACVSGLLD